MEFMETKIKANKHTSKLAINQSSNQPSITRFKIHAINDAKILEAAITDIR